MSSDITTKSCTAISGARLRANPSYKYTFWLEWVSVHLMVSPIMMFWLFLGIPSFRQHSLSNSWIWWLCHWPYQAPSRREMDTQSQLLLLKKILDLTQSKQQKILRGYKWANIDLEDGRQSPAEWWTRLWSCWFTNASFIALNVWGSVCLTLQARWYLTGVDLCCIASSP